MFDVLIDQFVEVVVKVVVKCLQFIVQFEKWVQFIYVGILRGFEELILKYYMVFEVLDFKDLLKIGDSY